jgi:hypothetical protein
MSVTTSVAVLRTREITKHTIYPIHAVITLLASVIAPAATSARPIGGKTRVVLAVFRASHVAFSAVEPCLTLQAYPIRLGAHTALVWARAQTKLSPVAIHAF